MFEPSRYATRYDQVRTRSVRSALRHTALSAMSIPQAAGRITPEFSKNRVHFLYLHHVFTDEIDDFRKLLVALSEQHSFVGYSEGVDRVLSGDIDKPYLTLSFDDGLKNCLQASQVMSEFDATACFFVCPTIVGETDHEMIEKFCAQTLFTSPTEFLSWDDVGTLLDAGHEIGSHTMTHPDLSRLSVQHVQDEVGGSFEMLTERVGHVKHFAWPYGRFAHFSPVAAKAVFEAGYKSCASAERGCHVAMSVERDDLCLRREHIVAGWPLSHSLYFMARSSKTVSSHSGQWPTGWASVIGGGS